MYEQFFSFMGLREDPFHVSPDPRFYYSTPAHESALAELLYGIETRQGFLVLTGEAGTGKTCLLNQILGWLRRRGRSSAYIFHTHLEPIGLFRFILSDFGVPCQSTSKSDLVNALHTWLLQRHAAQDLPVLILDEAQGLSLRSLDELRLLLNLETPRGKLLQIILSGQPELDEKLRLPALRQLRQRVMVHSCLPVLTQKETAAYISSRLATAGCSDSSLFPDEVVQDIYTSSRGIPRIVNLLCEHALISAYAERQRLVSPEMIQRIAADFDLLANPLAVTDLKLQPHYVRLAPFPIIEKPGPPAVTIEPAAKEDPIPTGPPAAPVEPPRYWRRHRSRSVVAALGHNSAVVVQRAWHGFTHAFVNYARSVRLALFPVIEKPRATSEANQRFTANSWAQIEFDIFTDPVAAVHKRTQPAAKEDPVPAVPPSASVEPPRYWRGHWSRSVVAALGHDSAAAVQRAWHRFTHAFVNYPRYVSRSFVRDCRLLFRGLALPMPAVEVGSSTEAANEKSVTNRNVLVPIVNWLRQPVAPANIFSNRSPARFAHRNVLVPAVNWLRQPVTPANIFSNRSPTRFADRR
jgi:general secretion pathway protein A